MKSWTLTPLAQDSLLEIALWTYDTFGPTQMERYEADILGRFAAIAEGRVVSQDCSVLLGTGQNIGLRFTRAGEHFVIFTEDRDEIVIVDFLHSQTDLPARLKSAGHL